MLIKLLMLKIVPKILPTDKAYSNPRVSATKKTFLMVCVFRITNEPTVKISDDA